MLSPRISNRDLGQLCDRVGVAFDVGHDPLKIFERETGKISHGHSRRMTAVAEHIKSGGTITEAVRAQGNYFPKNFCRLIEVGEQTGRLEKVLDRLSIYYTEMADLQSAFTSAITWPLIQLGLGLFVVSLLIVLPTYLVPDNAEAADMLGLGLTGLRGLAFFWAYVLTAAAVMGGLWWLYRNGKLGFIGDALAYVPGTKRLVRVFDEAAFVQALSLAVESGVDAYSAIGMAFGSCSSSIFRRQAETAQAAIRQGHDIYSTLKTSGLMSNETLEAIELGESSGRLAETLDKHYRFLQMRVRTAMAVITHIASSVVWIVISLLLIAVIFRVFKEYASVLNPGAIEQMFDPTAAPPTN